MLLIVVILSNFYIDTINIIYKHFRTIKKIYNFFIGKMTTYLAMIYIQHDILES